MRGAIPGAGHLVLLPSHIYYRVGRYLDALEDNKATVKVDEKYQAGTNAPMGDYRLGYYPNNMHFVMASADMAGDGPTVKAVAEKLVNSSQMRLRVVLRWCSLSRRLHTLPTRSSTARHHSGAAGSGDAIPCVKAMWLYVRGVALAANRDFAGATAAASAIERSSAPRTSSCWRIQASRRTRCFASHAQSSSHA